jgi:hypothetical protein
MIRSVLVLALLSSPADAHCFSIWKYPNAQRCGATTTPRLLSGGIAKRAAVPVAHTQTLPGPSFDIPLPDPDPATTALKAQLQ